MFDIERKYATLEELDLSYKNHLDSLRMGGFISPEEEASYLGAWAEAVENFRTKNS